MAKNTNIKTIYVRDENLQKYEELKSKADFFNWCLEHKLKDYQKQLEKKQELKK